MSEEKKTNSVNEANGEETTHSVKKTRNIALWVVSSVLVLSFGLNIFLGVTGFKKSEKIDMYEKSSQLTGSELTSALSDISYQKNKIDGLEKNINELEAEIKSCEEKIKNKIENEESLNKRIEALNGLISDKKNELKAAENEYKLLLDRYTELEKVCKVDFEEQLVLLSEISDLLIAPPKKITVTKEKDENDENKEIEKIEESDAVISVLYLDIERGYKYAFNAQHVFSSASVVKLPFALSLLQAASLDIEEHKKLNEETSSSAVTQAPFETGVLVEKEEPKKYIPFGFDEKFVYSPETYVEGSGVIQHKPYGTEYSFLELVDYSVRHSDNVAFRQITQKYTMDHIYKFARDNQLRSMMYNAWNMSAQDAATIMKLTYDFINKDENYGKFLENSLLEGAHTVMNVAGVYPKKCAHKYGWDTDAYHDVTLVYDEHPYIIVFMSDLHQGGKDVDKYIQTVARKIDTFHTNFYKE